MYKILSKYIYNSRNPKYTENQETVEQFLNKVTSAKVELICCLQVQEYSDCTYYEFIFKFKGE